MDRNTLTGCTVVSTVMVALRKESVDRNGCFGRAGCGHVAVALRKESVDRNIDNWTWASGMWVALRKESVDRNDTDVGIPNANTGRSPQGERG